MEMQVPAPDAPQTGPTTFLAIDDARLAEITENALTRLNECRRDMGLSFGNAIAQTGSWAWERQAARMCYKGNNDWRKVKGTVFYDSDQNWSLNIPARFIRLMAAKIADDLVGTDPFFATMPEKNASPELSKQVEAKVQNAIGNSKLRDTLVESIRVALTEGERPIKTTWVRDETQFTGPCMVAVDETGQPIQTPGGKYIYPNDDFVRVLVTQPKGDYVRTLKNGEQPTPHETAAVLEDGTTPAFAIQMRLRKEPQHVVQDGAELNFQLVSELEQTLTHRDELDASGLMCEDFIWPIHVPDLRAADIMAHCYDEPVENLEMLYGPRNTWRTARSPMSSNMMMAAVNQPMTAQGENIGLGTSQVRETVNVHETYYRVRVNPTDKHESWLLLVLDFKSRQCLYAEYIGNLKMKRPPFAMLRGLESEPGRAYGVGIYKRFADKNLAIDVWFNRAALKSSKSASLTFVHEDGVREVKDGEQLVIGSKDVWHIPANSEFGEDRSPVFRKNLSEISEMEMELMEKMIQSGQLEFGIVSAADGSDSGLNTSRTATGVQNIERTGNTLQRMTENMIASDISQVLELSVDCILENMDAEEMQFTPGSEELATLNREEIRDLERDVRLLLTKARSAESVEINGQTKATIIEYYQLPLVIRKKVRFAYVNILKSLDVADADEVLEDPTDEQIAAEAQAQAGADQPTQERINVALKDLTYSERAQALQKMGIKVGSQDEFAGLTKPKEPETKAA